jgi:hypothetical protein
MLQLVHKEAKSRREHVILLNTDNDNCKVNEIVLSPEDIVGCLRALLRERRHGISHCP